jgi:branched-chain amino acid transport system permease protein
MLVSHSVGLIYGQGGTISLAQARSPRSARTPRDPDDALRLSPVLSVIPAMLLPAELAFVIARPILRLPELSLALVTLSLGR